MRKALLVVTLILASFGGGAFVNGPGLVWLKGLMGLEPRPVQNLGGEPPPAFEDPPAVSVGPEPEPSNNLDTLKPADPDPAQPQSLVLAEPQSTPLPDLVPSSDPPKPSSDPDSPSPPPLEPPSQAHSEPQPITLDPIRPGVPTRQTTPAPTPPRPALAGPGSPPPSAPTQDEPGWGDAPGSAPATAILPRSARTSEPRQDPQISGASLPSQPTSEPEPAPTPEPSHSPAPPASGATWDALQKAMTARGVTRFWAEGEPSGSVTFRCVVPLAGRGAIAQQFEAQGPDVQTAAEAALKRIDLWKATERK